MGSKHGHTTHDSASPTYFSWRAMRARCKNKKHPQYKDYGGRGITICDSWNQFENFLADMGVRPEGKQLDRIDNNKGYYKENCRWATHLENHQNKRICRYITFRGRTQTVSAWAREYNMEAATLNFRVKNMPLEEAFTKPVRKYNLPNRRKDYQKDFLSVVETLKDTEALAAFFRVMKSHRRKENELKTLRREYKALHDRIKSEDCADRPGAPRA